MPIWDNGCGKFALSSDGSKLQIPPSQWEAKPLIFRSSNTSVLQLSELSTLHLLHSLPMDISVEINSKLLTLYFQMDLKMNGNGPVSQKTKETWKQSLAHALLADTVGNYISQLQLITLLWWAQETSSLQTSNNGY